jgi:hypothetical protein
MALKIIRFGDFSLIDKGVKVKALIVIIFISLSILFPLSCTRNGAKGSIYKYPKYRDYSVTDTSAGPLEYRFSFHPPTPFGTPINGFDYALPYPCLVKIQIYDATQKQIDSFEIGNRKPGTYLLEWFGYGFPSGVYFAMFQACDYTKTVKFTLLR